MDIDITEIVVSLIGILSVIITGIIIPLIKTKTTSAQWQNIREWTKTAVHAAEMIYKGRGKGVEKRNYVLNFIESLCRKNHIRYDESSIRNAIEDILSEMENKEG